MPEMPVEQPSSAPQKDLSKPRGLGKLMPARVRAMFDRNKLAEPLPQHVALHESSPPQLVDPVNEISAAPGLVSSDKSVTVPRPEKLTDVAITATTTAVAQSSLENGDSPIHPDIEEGARHVLEEKLVEMVKMGNVPGIGNSITALGEAWVQTQKAAGETFELTREGKQEIPERVREILAEHISEGLAKRYYVAAFGVREGWVHSITGEPQAVADLFKVADEFHVPISYLPAQEGEQPADNTPAVLISTSEQAVAHMQEVIDRNLPQGIHGIIKILGHQVGVGLLKDLPEYEEKINKWVSIMEQRGWSVVDQPATSPVIGEERSGLVPRQVNRAEIRQLADQIIRDNLAKGARNISGLVAFTTKSGLSDPLQSFGTPENIALYAAAGEKYGLTHAAGITAENSGVNPNLYFDPRELPAHVREALTTNLPAGFKAIESSHLRNVKEGNVGQTVYKEQVLEEYIRLAGEYDIEINPDKLRQEMRTHITPDNINEGVRHITEEVRRALREANYLSVSVHVRSAEELRKFVHDRGLDGKVNFSEMDEYLKQTATELPRLAEKTTD